jgi:hypothetical protein
MFNYHISSNTVYCGYRYWYPCVKEPTYMADCHGLFRCTCNQQDLNRLRSTAVVWQLVPGVPQTSLEMIKFRWKFPFLTNQYFMTWHRILSAAMQLHRPIARGLGNRLCHDTTNQAASIICTALFLSHGHPGWIVPSSCSFNYCMTTLITTGTLLHWDIILGWPPMPTIRAPKIRDPERFIAAWSMLILVNPIKQTWVISIFIGYK